MCIWAHDGENNSGKGQVSGICNLQEGKSAGYIERNPVSAWHVHWCRWLVMTYGNVIYVSTVAVSDDETVRATTPTHIRLDCHDGNLTNCVAENCRTHQTLIFRDKHVSFPGRIMSDFVQDTFILRQLAARLPEKVFCARPLAPRSVMKHLPTTSHDDALVFDSNETSSTIVEIRGKLMRGFRSHNGTIWSLGNPRAYNGMCL